MNFLDDATVEKQLFPFTLTRSAADLRIGILTIREKWQRINQQVSIDAVPSHLLPTPAVIQALEQGQPVPSGAPRLEFPWHLFQYNDLALRLDFELITAGRASQPLSSSNRVTRPEAVFLEEGARVEHCSLNASTGPIYVGHNAEIMEGSLIRGPFALCEGGVVKMGARIYGATTIGPYSVAAGEIKNAILSGYSNKGHDGYLGDAVIGEWCNLGAGTTNSNLKNNGGEVRIFNPLTAQTGVAGRKCGLLMGDYSRSAINTSFNTGTVTGVSCNIFCEGLTPTAIPSFSWGCKGDRYAFEKALHDIEVWKKFKNQALSSREIQKLQHIFEHC